MPETHEGTIRRVEKPGEEFRYRVAAPGLSKARNVDRNDNAADIFDELNASEAGTLEQIGRAHV